MVYIRVLYVWYGCVHDVYLFDVCMICMYALYVCDILVCAVNVYMVQVWCGYKLYVYSLCLCVFTHVGTHVPQHVCGGQRTTSHVNPRPHLVWLRVSCPLLHTPSQLPWASLLVSPPLPHGIEPKAHRCKLLSPYFKYILGIPTQRVRLEQQALCPLNHLLSPTEKRF